MGTGLARFGTCAQTSLSLGLEYGKNLWLDQKPKTAHVYIAFQRWDTAFLQWMFHVAGLISRSSSTQHKTHVGGGLACTFPVFLVGRAHTSNGEREPATKQELQDGQRVQIFVVPAHALQ